MTIFTIGYEGLEIGGFLSLLRLHNIETVVDIREFPVSRKPGFSKNGLASSLQQAGFGYVHKVRLGCPKSIRERYHTDRDWLRYTRGFLEYLNTQDEAIIELAAMAARANCALLCYEKDPNFCHRSLVADAVKKLAGAQVTHIRMADIKKAKPFVDGMAALA